MEIKTVVVGPLQTNCYLLIKNGKCLIVDPGDEALKIKNAASELEVVGILITHHHFDHVGALEELQQLYKVDVYDYNSLQEQEYNIADFLFEVIYTSGHTDDSITYYFKKEKVMFVGDFVFQGTIGRTDLETGNFQKMEKSIAKLKQYDDDIKLFPGHGNFTILGIEKKTNSFF